VSDLPHADRRNRPVADAVDPDVSITAAAPPPAAWYSGAVDRRLRPRRPLSQVALAGARASWHAGARWTASALAALTALMAATETHRVCDSWGSCDADDWGAAHTVASDLGATPFVLLALVIGLQLAGKDSKFVARMFSVVGAAIVSIIALGGVALAHFLSKVEGGDGVVFAALLTTGVCLFQLLLEPVLAVGQRRALEAREPEFPRAAVVSR
jgi:hypothetical protein